MKSVFYASIVFLWTSWASAFVVPDPTFVAPIQQQQYLQQAPSFDSSVVIRTSSSSSPLQIGIQEYLSSPSLSSSSMTLSLKDRPPPPTVEELAAKKRNFNFWFWGGGFVAPFLATFYYFGLKFWER